MKKIASIVLVSSLLCLNAFSAEVLDSQGKAIKGTDGKTLQVDAAYDSSMAYKDKTAAQRAEEKGITSGNAFYATIAGVLMLVVVASANSNGTTTTHMSAVSH